jgi:hypothetical protein
VDQTHRPLALISLKKRYRSTGADPAGTISNFFLFFIAQTIANKWTLALILGESRQQAF